MTRPPPATTPSRRRGYRWRSGVVYGTAGKGGRTLTLDLHAGDPAHQRPGVVFIHGGGWSSGNPGLLARLADELAADGYVTATINYRLSGEARWPAALEDAKCAVRWMRGHAAEIGLDPRRLAVAGGSAGGQLAAMVALTPGRFEGSGGWAEVSSQVQAAVLYNPVVDLRSEALGRPPLPERVQAFLGDDSDQVTAAQASPITHVTPTCPPILTRVGDQDEATPPAAAEAFHAALDAAGVPNRLEIVVGKGHALPVHDHAGCMSATTRFLGEHFTSVIGPSASTAPSPTR
ncbi:alpha/beta hydrolase fold domain-containing protein [Plantactinospora sp. DSM 117369]